LLSILVWFYFDREIAGQHERNRFLQAEIEKVKAQNKEIEELDAKKQRLLDRKRVIEELQANRSQMVHLFDSLVRTIPDGVVLTALKQEGKILTLEGTAQSNARVSTYMRSLETSGWMTKPDLSIIEARKGNSKAPMTTGARALPYDFRLKVELANPGASGDGEELFDALVSGEGEVVDAAAAEAPAQGGDAGAPADAAQPADAAGAQQSGGEQ